MALEEYKKGGPTESSQKKLIAKLKEEGLYDDYSS